MFAPLFRTGERPRIVFAQTGLPTPSVSLYAAFVMAAFIAAWKALLAAVVFVMEAASGHAFMVSAVAAFAVAYVLSGDAPTPAGQTVQGPLRHREAPDDLWKNAVEQGHGGA